MSAVLTLHRGFKAWVDPRPVERNCNMDITIHGVDMTVFYSLRMKTKHLDGRIDFTRVVTKGSTENVLPVLDAHIDAMEKEVWMGLGELDPEYAR